MVNNTLASSVDSEWVQTEIDPGTIEVQRNQTEIRGQRGSFRFRQKEYSVITVATFSPDSTLHSSPHSASAVRNGKEAIGDVKKGKGVNLCHHVRMQKLLGWFGDQSADSIAPREIELHFRAEKWAPATWNRYRALLSLTYRLAIRAGKVKENPARLVQHKAENNGRVRFLSPKEEENLRKTIREKFPEHEPQLDLAIHTGLRSGEQFGARWEDVDFGQRVLTVPLGKGGKTSHVPLSAAALRALLELRWQHGQNEFVCGGARSPRYWFEAAIEAAKIEGFTWHCLRHTLASRLVMSGADIRTVAELLRDKTLAMVMRYARLAPDYKLAAVERMACTFPNSKTDTKLTPALENQKSESQMVQ